MDRQGKTWVPLVGDFAILKEFLASKKQRVWHAVQLLDAFLRGFGQIVLANNPLSGLLIIVTLAAVAPGTLALSAATAGLGLLVSVLIREPDYIVESGSSVFNPLLVGAVSYSLIPQIYGSFDSFSFLIMLLATILSVYLSRSLRSDKSSCIAWPFNLAEFALIFALTTQNGVDTVAKSVEPMFEMFRVLVPNKNKFDENKAEDSTQNKIRLEKRSQYSDHTYLTHLHEGECYPLWVEARLFSLNIGQVFSAFPFFANYFPLANNATAVEYLKILLSKHNATSETTTTNDAGFYEQNATSVYVDWGMVVRGSVVSTSQLLGIDNVIVGCVMYLALLIYSPISTAFSYFGALCGTFAGLELGVDRHKAYSGMWGYNTFLTGAALGGNLLVLNGQTAVATIMAIIYTSLLQYIIESIFVKMQLPVLTLPFVIATSLFLKLSDGKEDLIFPWPVSYSFPEKQRHDYLVRCTAFREEDTAEELVLVTRHEKKSIPSDN